MDQSKPIRLEQADVTRLAPNPWNTNHVGPANEAKLRQSIERLGVFKPIICREIEDGTLQIIGGEHRWIVAKDMGYTSVPIVNLGRIDDVKAKEISLIDNGRFGEDDTLALAELLKELGDDDFLNILPYSDDEMASIFSATSIALEELDTPAEDLPDLDGEITKPLKTHQIMRFKVPVEDAEWTQRVLESCMNSQGFLDDDSMTNAGNALVFLLRKALA